MDWPNKLYDLFISHFAEQIGKKKVKISVDLYLKKHSLFPHAHISYWKMQRDARCWKLLRLQITLICIE